MNRVLKIVISAVVLFLLYVWISFVAKSCTNPGKTKEMSNTEEASEDLSMDEEIYDEYFESDEETTDDPGQKSEYSDVSNTEDDSKKYVEQDYSEVQEEDDFSFEEAPATKKKTTSARSNDNASGSGKYLVIAGSYLIKDNASNMAKRLRNLGYSDAGIINFDLSQYHSVTAGRYNSYAAASDAAKGVKREGIDCYVHTRK